MGIFGGIMEKCKNNNTQDKNLGVMDVLAQLIG
jgi:hypothetical protein